MSTKLLNRLNTSEVLQENIQTASVIRLPFRLRIGNFYRCSFEFGGGNFEIALRNLVSIPKTVSPDEIPYEFLLEQRLYTDIDTDAIVVTRNPKVEEDILNTLNKQPLDRDTVAVNLGDSFKAIGALNRFIIAYATVTKSLMGGDAPLRLLQTEPAAGIMDINLYLHWEVTILQPAGEVLPDEAFHNMFKLMPPHERQAMTVMRPPITDLSDTELANIAKILSLQEENYYLELAFEAKSKYLHGDSKGGLLMAVAALEGAHAALVQHELISRLSHNGKKDLLKDVRNLPDEYLISLGMSYCTYLTPYLLMDETERPPDSLIDECRRAITIRNEIMHAKTNRQGIPRIRNRSSNDISDAYSAVLKMYEYYLAAVEKRAENGATGI